MNDKNMLIAKMENLAVLLERSAEKNLIIAQNIREFVPLLNEMSTEKCAEAINKFLAVLNKEI